MRTIIAGSRTINDYEILEKVVRGIVWKPSLIISGGAMGVDKLGERYAKEHNLPLKIYPANWKKYGKVAGFVRNWEMADNADALIAIWDGESRGTEHMIRTAEKRKLLVVVKIINQDQNNQ